jgi:drug/metabolite transporter (DMT)-like permease
MGALYLAGYIVSIGVATFLLKYVSDDLSPYQINFLMAVGMIVIGVPALLVAERTLALPRAGLPLGGLVGLLMAAGSILYVLAIAELPVGLASAIATSYVVLVVVLSRIVLHESLSAAKVLGLALTIGGVALLSYVGE